MEQEQNLQNSQTIPVGNSSSSQDENLYIPSSVEKKRALTMYFLFGIMIVIAEKKTNNFEYFHLKQAIGRWISFMVCLVVSLIVLFIPLVRILGILVMLSIAGILVVLVKQAWDGKYHSDFKGYSLAIFPSLGNWLLGLFDVKIGDPEPGVVSDSSVPPMPPVSSL